MFLWKLVAGRDEYYWVSDGRFAGEQTGYADILVQSGPVYPLPIAE